ncbi:MAG TPA: AAC(3) family N-acetyltransferase, partial [Myxococcaceae bacterium]
MDVPKTMLTEQLRTLGVAPGQVLLVHASFRALRPVEGGPRGVLAALLEVLGPEGTLVMPSWTGRDDLPFDRAATPASPDLGVLAETFRRLPGVKRSAHPFAF